MIRALAGPGPVEAARARGSGVTARRSRIAEAGGREGAAQDTNMRDGHKWAMMRNLVTSLIKHERIRTTTAKAKMIKPLADKMVTLAKKDTPFHRTRAHAIITESPVVVKLFEQLGPRYAERQGGYTRVLKLMAHRRGDAADMSIIEYVDRPGEARPARPPQGAEVDVEGFL
eukprot:CAMPEP_0198427032 /NCGR_PEP_ID=MMETSP1452-20131203/5644_1 /TAXON_ID=1181717 /ORGANISM="Synchroma pusillum, Strain CCMP3072" /LENGTH=171 /DNA_ID=CAMNT_0044147409 /DNA_START=7 /DNA_END=519 /DNA_ORIENTATION=+